jgi:sugar phosphate isomerase/epimerase
MSASSDLNWCFSTLGCPAATLDGIVALAHRHGIEQVELRAVAERMDLAILFDELGYTPASLAAWFREAGIAIPLLNTSARLIGAREEHRAELRAFAPWAEALGAKGLRIFDGGSPGQTPSASQLEEAARMLAWWEAEKRAQGWSVDLFIETHDALVRTEGIQRLMAAAATPVQLLWDSHHTWRVGGEDPLATWSAIRSHVRHVHFMDSQGIEAPTGHPYTYVNLGDGEFPLDALFRRLRADGFAGPVSLEWERSWHPYLGELAVPLHRLDRWR